MQIPILSGTYTNASADLRQNYPVNMMPIVAPTQVSSGYLRPALGAVSTASVSGAGRGGIEWDGVCYRVIGGNLVRVSSVGAVTTIGAVGTTGRAAFDYSFDWLAVVVDGAAYLCDGAAMTQITDVDLGTPLDVIWVDGYFMFTDGEYLIVTELTDPFVINPLKYGSSEANPDKIKALKKIRNEVYAINRYTTEVFDNTGGELFPFSRIEGAQIQKGAISTHACCVFEDTIAIVGGGLNESPGVYAIASGSAQKISSREIDLLLSTYQEVSYSSIVLESKVGDGQQQLWLRLPDRTMVFDAIASKAAGDLVWYTMVSAVQGFAACRMVDVVRCYSKWLVADSEGEYVGYLSDTVSSHFGDTVRWEFSTQINYNESRGAIFHELELVALPGLAVQGDNPQVSTSYSVDGVAWSQDKWISAGEIGDRTRRLVWYRQGIMRNMRIQRFRGDSTAFLSVLRLEAKIEPLAA